MTPSHCSAPDAYAWRKYQCAVPVYRWSATAAAEHPRALYLWPAADDNQHPRLNRWEKLEPAFVGFISIGEAAPSACAYSARGALESIRSSILYPQWAGRGADAASCYEYMLHNLLGVWMGEATPFLLHDTEVLTDSIKKASKAADNLKSYE